MYTIKCYTSTEPDDREVRENYPRCKFWGSLGLVTRWWASSHLLSSGELQDGERAMIVFVATCWSLCYCGWQHDWQQVKKSILAWTSYQIPSITRWLNFMERLWFLGWIGNWILILYTFGVQNKLTNFSFTHIKSKIITRPFKTTWTLVKRGQMVDSYFLNVLSTHCNASPALTLSRVPK